MTSSVTFRARIVEWQDAAFVRAFEDARLQAISEGLIRNGPKAAARVERLLRERGYPGATIHCDRTVEEALERAARWTVAPH